MFVANFLTGPGTDKVPYNVKLTFYEYLLGKVNPNQLLRDLTEKYDTNFVSDFYYIGVRYAKV
tara:strand:+ start:462 stop:650 length:189 start_codon:yes stop_codon:yes gene_type:complete